MNQNKLLIILTTTFVVLVFILFLVNSLLSNGTSTNPVQKPVVIEFWGSQTPEEVMNVMTSEYRKLKPNVTIKYSKKVYDTNEEYRDFIVSSLKEGRSADILEISQSWTPFLSSVMSASNDAYSSDDFKSTFFGVYRTSCINSSSKITCVPLTYDGLMLAYNKDMFSRAGMTPPTTWDDLRQAAIKMTVRSGRDEISVSGAALGTTNNISNASDIIILMLNQSDVKLPNDLDTEQAVTAINYYSNFAIRDKVWDENMVDSVKAFATQKTAMAFVNIDQVREILDLNPTISMGIVPPPQLPLKDGGLTSEYVSTNRVEMVSNKSSWDKQKESWAFLKWLSLPEQQKRMSQEYSKYAKFGNLFSVKALANDNTLNEQYMKPFLRVADSATWSLFSSNNGTDDFAKILLELVGKDDYDDFKKAEETIRERYNKGL